MAEDDEVGAVAHGGVRFQGRPAGLVRKRPGLVAGDVRDQQLGTVTAAGEPARKRARHVPRTDQTDLHRAARISARDRYDWLKKPFSTNRARSSAETSTLRGVSRKVLSAIRCIPPSSA